MSHRYPRLIANDAGVTFVNSMHGVVLREDAPSCVKDALPLLALNSASMLGAEMFGRSYGGGILKMEPSEASKLPVPAPMVLARAWASVEKRRARLEELLRARQWQKVVDEVDEAVLVQAAGVRREDVLALRGEAARLRQRRTRKTE